MAVQRASIAKALARCRRASELSGGSVLVGLSGGKDSLATLDVVCRSEAFDRVQCFAMYLVPGLECFEAPVRAAAERHGVPVEFVPHWDLARLFRYSVLRPHTARATRVSTQSLSTVERALEVQFGITWSALGYRSADSVVRAIDARGCDGVHEKFRRLWPIWDWGNAAVHHYLRVRRIPEPVPLRGTQSSGVSLDTQTLTAIRDRYPSDYRKILEVFPYAEAQVRRRTLAVSGVRGAAAASPRGQGRGVQPAADRQEGTAATARGAGEAEAPAAARVE